MRREFALEEGNVFSSAALDLSVLRLNQLGFFEKIEEKDYTVTPDAKNAQVDVTVKVKERSQQSIGLTGGVSGISGSFLGLNYTTNNFLGRGETLEFAVTGGTRTTDFLISFHRALSDGFAVESWAFPCSTSAIVLIPTAFTDLPALLRAGIPSSFSPGTPPVPRFRSAVPLDIRSGDWERATPTRRSESVESRRDSSPSPWGSWSDLPPGGNAAQALEGIIRSEVTPTLSYNTTNHYFNPTRGMALTISSAVAGGILGGDFSMIRPLVEYRHFFPDRLISKGRNTFGYRFLGEYIKAFDDSVIPFFERFFIGGETTLRGFDIRSISPLAISSTPALDPLGSPVIDLNTGLPRIDRNITPIGGDTMVMFNGEYRIPIAGPLSMAVFYDVGFSGVTSLNNIGNLGNTSINLIEATNNVIRGSSGVEIQFLLPVVSAPFRLIFAFNPHTFNDTILVGTTPLQIREPRRDIKFTIGRSF